MINIIEFKYFGSNSKDKYKNLDTLLYNKKGWILYYKNGNVYSSISKDDEKVNKKIEDLLSKTTVKFNATIDDLQNLELVSQNYPFEKVFGSNYADDYVGNLSYDKLRNQFIEKTGMFESEAKITNGITCFNKLGNFELKPNISDVKLTTVYKKIIGAKTLALTEKMGKLIKVYDNNFGTKLSKEFKPSDSRSTVAILNKITMCADNALVVSSKANINEYKGLALENKQLESFKKMVNEDELQRRKKEEEKENELKRGDN